ncbi:alkaline phosphatase [Aestuariibacter halophilus]|uniref:Alkaline phosphatase n=1 Tax=Fluctibacter halophilus TaxID=226011 RepID=A0ABS8G6Q2_9ALTE|nr:alkaline phosphatase [Aestuariibacter halophilus]MCC2616198.1 alkaline phosphatase [Aestuariibacter halophilus]
MKHATLNKLFVGLSLALSLTACSGDDGDTGPAGANGSPGTNALIDQTALAVGNENCPNGGLQIDSGLDSNADGVLGSSEITETQYLCTPGITQVTAAQIRNNTSNPWYSDAAQQVEAAKDRWMEATQGATAATARAATAAAAKAAASKGAAKNVILFVGDGMGISTVTAARILAGQMQGLQGEEYQLSFEKFPFAGLAKTYNVDAQTPDSAGTMTAMMSGVKTDVGVIGVDADIERGECSTVAGNELVTSLELAEIAGKSTGIISTARITHATPAATYAKSADRNWEDISDMPQEAIDAGCTDIAAQLVNFEANLEARYDGLDVDGIEVVMGGGRRHFLPKDAAFNSNDAVSSVEGDRTDNRDLTAEWQATYPNGQYVYDQASFNALDLDNVERVFGLFNESHMQYEADRANDVAGEPSLTEMTEAAISVLDNNDEGFFLMVESGRIDHGHHAGSAYGALTDTIEFASAIEKAAQMTNSEDTLIIVTADHGHVFTIAGYPKRGNPILGKVVGVGSDEPSLAADGMPYTTLGYTNGLGYRNLGDETNADASYAADPVSGRMDLTGVDTTTPGYHQEALVPLSSETHSGEDVGIFAQGPGSFMVNGTNEQNMLFHIINHSANLVEKADAALQ